MISLILLSSNLVRNYDMKSFLYYTPCAPRYHVSFILITAATVATTGTPVATIAAALELA